MKTIKDPQILAEIRDRIVKLTPNAQRQWGQMTAHQMLCHLVDSKRGVMGERPLADVSTWLQRTFVKAIALYLPMPWPKGVKTRPESDQLVGGTKPIDFARDKAALLQLVDRFTSPSRDFQFVAHPIFGKMSENE